MNIKDKTTHERKIFCHFDAMDLRAILTKYLAEKTGFKIDPRKTRISVTFDKKDEGSRGFTDYARVVMTNDL